MNNLRLRQIIPFVDLSLEVADARLPESSRNAALMASLGSTVRLLILNKADLADPRVTRLWKRRLEADGITVIPLAAHSGAGMAALEQKLAAAKVTRPSRGQRFRPLRIIVMGIPNVGKSTIINRLVGRGALRTGAAPGVTKGPQWLRIRTGMELLDTPGMLTARTDVPAWKLAAVRAVLPGDDVIEHAQQLISAVSERYNLEQVYDVKGPLTLAEVARRRGLIGRGGEPDLKRAAVSALADFNRGRWGRITLELPLEPETEV